MLARACIDLCRARRGPAVYPVRRFSSASRSSAVTPSCRQRAAFRPRRCTPAGQVPSPRSRRAIRPLADRSRRCLPDDSRTSESATLIVSRRAHQGGRAGPGASVDRDVTASQSLEGEKRSVEKIPEVHEARVRDVARMRISWPASVCVTEQTNSARVSTMLLVVTFRGSIPNSCQEPYV